jgi:hypothetical protein
MNDQQLQDELLAAFNWYGGVPPAVPGKESK